MILFLGGVWKGDVWKGDVLGARLEAENISGRMWEAMGMSLGFSGVSRAALETPEREDPASPGFRCRDLPMMLALQVMGCGSYTVTGLPSA